MSSITSREAAKSALKSELDQLSGDPIG